MWAVPMGIAAGIAVTSVLLMVMRLEQEGGERAGELKGLGGFDPDDAMLLVPAAIWAGASDILLYAAAIGAPVFAVAFFIYFRIKLKAETG